MSGGAERASRHRLPASLLMLVIGSGCASLIYEVTWTRRLSLLFGASTWAVATVLAAFLGGLALGAWMLGEWIDRVRSPLRTYALLEIGIGAYAVAFPWLTDAATAVYLAIAPPVAGSLPALTVMRAGLAFLLVVPPTVLMGATLPLMCRFVDRRPVALGRDLGRLCAFNTLGAAVGALLAGFVLLGSLGLRGTNLAAASLNLVVAAGAWTLSRQPHEASGEPRAGVPRAPATSAREVSAVLMAMALSGAAALGYEVLWTRALATALHSGFTYAFALMLATFLAGLGIGGLLHARFAAATSAPLRLLSRLQVLLAIWAFASIGLLGELPRWERLAAGHGLLAPVYTWSSWLGELATASLLVVLPPTLLLGIAFPLAGQVVAAGVEGVGARIGRLAACNTLGSIVGSLATGFVLVPRVGTLNTVALLAALNLGAAVLLQAAAPVAGAERWGTAAIACLLLGGGWFGLPSDHWAASLGRWRQGAQIYFAEDATGVVEVYEERARSGDSYRRLYVNQTSYASTSEYARRYHKLLGHLPALLHPEPEHSLVIAFGTGMTAGALARHPEVKRVDCVDLSSAVFAAAPQFAAANGDVARQAKTRLILEDGRNFLLLTRERYDLITLEPPPPRFAGVAGLYSREFYLLLRERLREGGVAAQWIPMHSHTEEEMRMLVRSFVEVFPESTLWLPVERDAILVGAVSPGRIDAAAIERRASVGAVATDLADAGIGSAAALFATLALDRDRLQAYVQGVSPITDDRPEIEFFAGRSLVEAPVHLQRLLPFRLGADDLLATLGRAGGAQGEGAAALRFQLEAIGHYYRGAALGAQGDLAGRAAAWALAAQLARDDSFLGSLAGG